MASQFTMSMKSILIVCFLFLSMACQPQDINFPGKALQDVFLSLENEEIAFYDILKKYEGKTVFIDVWASWCKDCIEEMPKLKELQKEYNDVVFLFLSLDRDLRSWKKGIGSYDLQGEHYYVLSGWKGDFGSAIRLDWIPRYMIINPMGEISLYKAVELDDSNIKSVLNTR